MSSFDIVVIGGGLAGTVAALTALSTSTTGNNKTTVAVATDGWGATAFGWDGLSFGDNIDTIINAWPNHPYAILGEEKTKAALDAALQLLTELAPDLFPQSPHHISSSKIVVDLPYRDTPTANTPFTNKPLVDVKRGALIQQRLDEVLINAGITPLGPVLPIEVPNDLPGPHNTSLNDGVPIKELVCLNTRTADVIGSDSGSGFCPDLSPSNKINCGAVIFATGSPFRPAILPLPSSLHALNTPLGLSLAGVMVDPHMQPVQQTVSHTSYRPYTNVTAAGTMLAGVAPMTKSSAGVAMATGYWAAKEALRIVTANK